MPNAVAAEHPTGLQRRLIAEIGELMRLNDKRLRDLVAATGIGKSYLSLMMHGHRPGTMAAWDAVIRATRRWPIQFPPLPLTTGYDPKGRIDMDGLDDTGEETPEIGHPTVAQSPRPDGRRPAVTPRPQPSPSPVRPASTRFR